ncbi:hypothetical protein CISG_04153 [Coccidioides immitis RMSCC 3703]|uniref:Protein kinase domain-containing protein n=2 Tax=Coccidioides immitis TaxID=5501 RepID=A0A0J8QT48_COCIT|nr:hypothetical protein CIRG_06589 [Coccidioides immitis RMSCC 2394]KMU75205.1 hypothetical protein CISG_04153 [Coccidioides immitis RMSCC 3703]
MDINTRIEELQRQLKEAEERAEQAERIAEDAKGIAEDAKARAEEAEHLRENEQRLRQALENRINLTTFETFLRSCHEYITVPLNIQPKKSKTTKGSITTPTGRYCPTTLCRWTDFPRLRNELFNRVFSLFHPTEAPPLEVFPSTEVVRGVGNLVSRRQLGSELDLLSYERFAVEEHVISIMQELLKLDTGTHLPLLGSGISFENHANTLSDELELTPQKHQGWRPRSDQLCVFRKDDEVETLLFIIEYKAGHKLLPANLRAGLQPSNFWEDVVQAHLIPTDQEEKLIYNAKQITGAAITQAFDYMIKEGVEYGYLTTGEVFIFLHIKEDDPTTLYYHLSEPVRDIEAQDGNPFPSPNTAVSSVLSLCLLALGSQKRDQEWRSHAFSILHTWAIDVEYILAKMPAEERSRTPSGSSFVPSSPLSSPIQQEQSRRSRRLQGRCADSDDTAEDSPSDSSEGDDPSNRNAMSKWGSKRFAVVISPPRPPAAKRQQQSQEERRRNREPERQYCTQRCLAGLANRAALDQACPNITLHRTMSQDDNHPIFTARVAALLEAQLNNDRDNGCRPLKFFGAYGILFKMTLAKYGYTFVGKGTIEGLIHHLQHEAKVYEYLSKLQGSVNLKEPFITDGLDRIVHYLLLSWAGDSLDYSQHCDFHQEARRLQKELGRYGVVHGDVRPANVTWNSELSRPMLIDFDKARLVRKRPLTGSGPKATHSHAIKRKRRSLFQVDV